MGTSPPTPPVRSGRAACADESTVETSSRFRAPRAGARLSLADRLPAAGPGRRGRRRALLPVASYGYSYVKPSEDWTALPSLAFIADNSVRRSLRGRAPGWSATCSTSSARGLFTTVYHSGSTTGDDAATMDAAFRERLRSEPRRALGGGARRQQAAQRLRLAVLAAAGAPRRHPVAPAAVCGAIDVFDPFTLASPSLIGFTSTTAAFKLEACDDTPFVDRSAAGVAQPLRPPRRVVFRREQPRPRDDECRRGTFAAARADLRAGHQPDAVRRPRRLSFHRSQHRATSGSCRCRRRPRGRRCSMSPAAKPSPPSAPRAIPRAASTRSTRSRPRPGRPARR